MPFDGRMHLGIIMPEYNEARPIFLTLSNSEQPEHNCLLIILCFSVKTTISFKLTLFLIPLLLIPLLLVISFGYPISSGYPISLCSNDLKVQTKDDRYVLFIIKGDSTKKTTIKGHTSSTLEQSTDCPAQISLDGRMHNRHNKS